jgi:hypothetical protein
LNLESGILNSASSPDTWHPAPDTCFFFLATRHCPFDRKFLTKRRTHSQNYTDCDYPLRALILYFLLIPVLDAGSDVLEVLNIAGDDCSAALHGMGRDEDVSIVMGFLRSWVTVSESRE